MMSEASGSGERLLVKALADGLVEDARRCAIVRMNEEADLVVLIEGIIEPDAEVSNLEIERGLDRVVHREALGRAACDDHGFGPIIMVQRGID